LGILRNPTSIFYDDKISFHFFPKTGNALAREGHKDEIDRRLAKASTKAVLAFSAAGIMCPPMVMCPYKRIASAVAQGLLMTGG
jgi:hypothetical protein